MTLLALLLLAAPRMASAAAQPWVIRAVVLTTYEAGADTGDAKGELQPWVEGEALREKLAFPLGVHDLYTNADHDLLVAVTGTTTGPAAASVMALGTDPRFDLRKAYWLMDGISGFDPKAASLGSVAWSDWVVGDIMRGVDPREVPRGWPYGFFMEGARGPNIYQPPDASSGVVHNLAWELNPGLTRWAYDTTRDVTLVNSARMIVARRFWSLFPAAQKPPSVLIGGDFASDTFWHGRIMTGFAEDWVRLATRGHSHFVSSNMEDAGAMESLWRLSRAGRIDIRRVMMLRTGSNYTEQHDGLTAVQSINGPFAADTESLVNGYRVGAKIVHEILTNWSRYDKQVP